PSEARFGRRDEEAAVGQAGADVAGRGVDVAACEERRADAADLLAQHRVAAHADSSRCAKAWVKKSVPPKLPDLSARCSACPGAAGEVAAVQGTPGSICVPIVMARTPSAWTTAPDVSPPATTSWRTPACTRPTAMSDKA